MIVSLHNNYYNLNTFAQLSGGDGGCSSPKPSFVWHVIISSETSLFDWIFFGSLDLFLRNAKIIKTPATIDPNMSKPTTLTLPVVTPTTATWLPIAKML